MLTRYLLPFLLLALLCTILIDPLLAQSPHKTAAQLDAAYQAHKGDFDYLLGDWEFTSQSKQWGKGHGFWSAVRLASGQILDEYRVVGDKGEIYTMTMSLRAYNAVNDQWDLISFKQSDGLRDFGTAHREGNNMIIDQRFDVMTSSPTLMHIRYHDIRSDHFLWNGDRSTDNGKTWEKDFLIIDAHRIGPPRSQGPLVPPKEQAQFKSSR